MKKLLLFLSCIFMLSMNVHADKACFHGSTKPSGFKESDYDVTGQWELKTGQSYASCEIEGVMKLEFTSAQFDADLTRWYSGATMTLTPASGVTITSFTFTDNQNSSANVVSVVEENGTKNGSVSCEGSSKNFIYDWTGNSTTPIKLKNSSQVRFKTLTVEYTSSNVAAVESVDISYDLDGAEGIVTMSCATEGASILYGFSEDAIDTPYTAPFRVTESCVVYAQAVKGEDKSRVKSQTIKLPFTHFKDVLANCTNKDAVSMVGNFEVLFQSGSYLMLTDGVSNAMVYNYPNTYEPGTKFSAIEATVTIYASLFELTSVTFTEGGTGATITPAEIESLDDINYTDNLFDLVKITGSISGKNGKNATITLGGKTVALYNNFNIEFDNGEGYEITGYVWRNGNTLQICPVLIEGGWIKETVATPVIAPDKTDLTADETISMTCATEDARIYYTLDGTEPTQQSTAYETPFTISGDRVTVKACAYYEGEGHEMFPSAIVSKTYHVANPAHIVINTAGHESSGSTYTVHQTTIDGVEYSMNTIHNSTQGIQLNNSSSRLCYIIQRTENVGFVIDNLVADYNDKTNTKKFEVRGSNTPFSDTSELNNVKTNGVVIGTIDKDNQTLSFTRDYKYFAIYPTTTGAVYLNYLAINYREPAPIAEAPVLSDELEEDFYSDEESILFPELPTHPDWTPMYQINDGEAAVADADCHLHEEALDAATLHTIKIWYEHYNGINKTEPKEYRHVTGAQITVENAEEGVDNALTTINFGTIGEGVTVYFTLNGTVPSIPAQSAEQARATVSTADGVYKIETLADLDAVHAVTAANPVVTIKGMGVENAPEIELVTLAHHAEAGVASSVKYHTESINLPTGIEDITVGNDAEALYFNLQGVRVDNPVKGTFIRVIGSKAEKVMK